MYPFMKKIRKCASASAAMIRNGHLILCLRQGSCSFNLLGELVRSSSD